MFASSATIRGLAIAIFIGCSGVAQAFNSFQYAYVYDGSTLTEDLSASGSQLDIGDTVTLKLFAKNGHWSAAAGQTLWAPISMLEAGNRTGDLAWSFLMNGALQDSGSYTGQFHQFVHVANPMNPSINIDFDELDWTFTLTNYEPDPLSDFNTLGGIFCGKTGFCNAPTFLSANQIPEPPLWALLGLGLLGFAISRRAPPTLRIV